MKCCPDRFRGHHASASSLQTLEMRADGVRGGQEWMGFWKQGSRSVLCGARWEAWGVPTTGKGEASPAHCLCFPVGPGREDRRPGPPPRDHHHRCLLHWHRAGEHRAACRLGAAWGLLGTHGGGGLQTHALAGVGTLGSPGVHALCLTFISHSVFWICLLSKSLLV